jgi:hypothetical protein
MSVDLNLPTFGLDCREWLVATEAEGLLIEEADGAPVVAVLSTAVIEGDELSSAQAVFSLALVDEETLGAARTTDSDGAHTDVRGHDICVLDADWHSGYARFAVPVPGGELAIVAEFSSAPDPGTELVNRFYDLVTSFRWAA